MLKTDTYRQLSNCVSIMGIVNVTPDSFSDGGRFQGPDAAFLHAKRLVEDGAAIIDIGGESTRPGAEEVSVQEELDRTIPVVERVAKQIDCTVSIDTYKAIVAAEALKYGAHIVNDISGLTFDVDMLNVVSKADAGLVVMHIKGTPRNMQDNPTYADVLFEIKSFLSLQCAKAEEAGVRKLFIDPGFGFGKRLNDNFTILKNLHELVGLGYPVVVGTSRKSFLGSSFDAPPEDRLEGTLISNFVAVQKGARILRVHDVASMNRALIIARHIGAHPDA